MSRAAGTEEDARFDAQIKHGRDAAVVSPDGKTARYCRMQPSRWVRICELCCEASCLFFSCGVLVSPLICYDLRVPELFCVAATHLITVIAS